MDNEILEDCRAVYLTAEDLRIAASILYNAYHDDPFLSIHSLPQTKPLMSKNCAPQSGKNSIRYGNKNKPSLVYSTMKDSLG